MFNIRTVTWVETKDTLCSFTSQMSYTKVYKQRSKAKRITLLYLV